MKIYLELDIEDLTKNEINLFVENLRKFRNSNDNETKMINLIKNKCNKFQADLKVFAINFLERE
jgi:hypothetical protein